MNAWKQPAASSSQPTALCGRCQAISTPATAQDSAIAELVTTNKSVLWVKLNPTTCALITAVNTPATANPNRTKAVTVLRRVRPGTSLVMESIMRRGQPFVPGLVPGFGRVIARPSGCARPSDREPARPSLAS